MTATKFIGRRFNVGIAKEATRGTALASTYWLPKTAISFDDKVNTAIDDTSTGVIEDAEGHENTSKFSEGTIEGLVTDQSLGLILLATLGSESALSAVETGVKDHNFAVGESAQHQSLTISVVEPNSNSGAGYGYPLGMVDTLDLTLEVGKYASYKMGIRANVGASLSNTTSYVAENHFRPQDGSVKFASSLSGLSGATATVVKKMSLSVKKNIEDDIVIGNISPVDRLNKQFAVEGTVELLYSDRTFIDTNLLGDVATAVRFAFTNTNVTIGATSNPTLTIDLAKAKFIEIARKIDNNGLVTLALKFKAYYSLSDAKMITAILRNTVTALY